MTDICTLCTTVCVNAAVYAFNLCIILTGFPVITESKTLDL